MLFRKVKKAPPARPANAFDDPTSIGNVLLKLGKVTQEQLTRAVGQKAQFDEALLGTLLKQMGFVQEMDIALALKIQAELRSGATLTAELDILQSKMDESASGAHELATRISVARTRRRSRGEKSGLFLVPAPLAHSRG
jgi:hypothetical protein